MLLFEQVRQIMDEEILLDASADKYSDPHDWTTKKSKTITLDKEKIVYVKIKVKACDAEGNGRVLLDSIPLVAIGAIDDTEAERDIFLVLPAGTYTFDFQTAGWSYGSVGYVQLTKAYIATLNFPDKLGLSFDSGEVTAPQDAWTNVINQDFTVPSTRKLPIGQIKKYCCIITVYATNTEPGERRDKMQTTASADYFAWRLQLDNVTRAWSGSRDDLGSSVGTKGVGAYGRYITVLDPGTTHNLKIQVYNDLADGNSHTVRATVRIIICPWIIPNSEYEPVELDFPDGSTIYIILEPLNSDPTKTIKLGKKRFVSFGDSTDYYSTASGTGILSWNYTFELIPVKNCILKIGGYGGCVSVIGVDVR